MGRDPPGWVWQGGQEEGLAALAGSVGQNPAQPAVMAGMGRAGTLQLGHQGQVLEQSITVSVDHGVAKHGFIVSRETVWHKLSFPNYCSVSPYTSGMLDLNRLRVLRAVVASGSVNETARHLGYTPSTVSQHVHTLEREVGFPLIERIGRGIRPTPAAIELARASTPILAAMSDLEARARDLRQGASEKLTVTTFASAAYTWMPTIARTLRQEFPGLTLELSINEADSAANHGEADIEVHTEVPFDTPSVPRSYSRVELGDDQFLVALPLDHPLAGLETADLAEFEADDWVQYDFRDDLATRLTAHACAAAGISPRYVARAQDHVTGLAFVAGGVGIALVPGLALGWSDFDIAWVRPTNPTPSRRIVALVRNRARTNPAAARSLELLTELGATLTQTGLPRPS